MIGAPGSGKSSWTKEIIGLAEIISSDDILDQMAIESGITYAQSFHANIGFAKKLMNVHLEQALLAGRSVVIDETNMSVKARRKILARIPSHYRLFAAVFMIDRDELDRRLIHREQTTGKYVPPDAVTDFLAKYEEPTTTEFEMIFR